VASCIIIALLYVVSVFATMLAPYSYDEGSLEAQNFPPTWYKVVIDDGFQEKLVAWAEKHKDESVLFSELSEDSETEEARPEGEGFFASALNHLDAASLWIYYKERGKWDHMMGTDEIGQDIFSRVIYGMKLSLLLALVVTFVSVLIGVSYGAISGYVGGLTDTLMMRFVDFLFGVPFIFLIILLMVFFGRKVILIFVGLGLIYWIVLARIVRGQILSFKQREFVLAAKSNGVREISIIFRHLVPNVLGPVIVFSTLLVPQIMLLEAFLSFIGLGISPPEVSMGILISDGANVISNYAWPILYPGIIFSLVIFCMNFIGDGLRDALDPKSTK
jgi:oligopeptide transport system permease protein